jgi:hypothetical protein
VCLYVYLGQVGDGDCYAMGGIAGHAGIFSTAGDIGHFLQYMVSVLNGVNSPDSNFLNASTIKFFTTVHNATQSSRALGWTVNIDEVLVYIWTYVFIQIDINIYRCQRSFVIVIYINN